jgi:transcriptional coactivator HFI1/ADA1
MPAIAHSDGALPSSHQLSLRLSQLAKAYDLTLAPDATAEIGEFLAVGMDSHVADVMTSLVRLIGQDRKGVDTIHVPRGESSQGSTPDDHLQTPKSVIAKIKEENDLPKPDLDTMKSLFNLVPELHTQASPSVYKLMTSQLKHENYAPDVKPDISSLPLNPTPRANGAHVSTESTASKLEVTRDRLVKSELLKLDPGKGEGEGKKNQKHNLHWKYEDPAVLFQDLLG